MTHGDFLTLRDDDDKRQLLETPRGPSQLGAPCERRHSAPGKIVCESISFSIVLRIWSRLLKSDGVLDPEIAFQAVAVATVTNAWIDSSNRERSIQGRHSLCLEDRQAITACMNHLVQVLGTDPHGRLDACELLYQALLRFSSESIRWSIAQLSNLLREAGYSDSGIFDTVRDSLDTAAHEDGSLPLSDAVLIFCRTLWKTVQETIRSRTTEGCEPLEEILTLSPEEGAKEIIDALGVAPDSRISISLFMVCCLGRPRREVLLHQYDLTGGRAKMMSSMLSFMRLDAVWHTGIVVFEKEYFFNGQLVLDSPGETIFGTPTKISHVGYTHRRKKELHAWVVSDLKQIFTLDKYDLVDNNCNHFTNSMANWLCQTHIPNEVLGQGDMIKSNPMLGQVLRPVFWCVDSCHCNSSVTGSVVVGGK